MQQFQRMSLGRPVTFIRADFIPPALEETKAEVSCRFSSNLGFSPHTRTMPKIKSIYWHCNLGQEQLIQTAGRINFIYRMLLGKCQVKKVWKSYKDKLVIACFTLIVFEQPLEVRVTPNRFHTLEISACYFCTLSLLDWNKPTTACWQFL